ncbi:MAG: hypothetical protein M3015_13205 [Bacteroidota bacterium]|nr:hypothetical protein [Bacteroidota bacterium]
MYKKLSPFLLLIIVSCATPGIKLTNDMDKINKNLQDLKTMIIDEFPNSKVGYSVSNVKNPKLRNILQSQNVSQISITYKALSIPSNISHKVLPSLKNELDSTITFSWINEMDHQTKYNNLYYFFGRTAPALRISKTGNDKNVRINDSIWIQKIIYDNVTIY